MTSILETFPIETLSSIMDALAEADEENWLQQYKHPFLNVRACSQTCRTFLPMARKYIFKTLGLPLFYPSQSSNPFFYHRESRPSPAKLFSNLLVKTPEIAHYVKVLKINCRLPTRSDQVDHRASLLSVIQKLSALTTIELSGGLNIPSFNWKDVPDVIQPILFRAMGLPTLTRLDFRGFNNFSLSILSHCTALRILNLQSIELADVNDPPSSDLFPVSKPIPLARIGLEKCSIDVLPRMSSQKQGDGNLLFSFERLGHFTLEIAIMQDLELAATFLKSAPQKEIIDITVCGNIQGGTAIEAIAPCLQTLKQFSLGVLINHTQIDPLSGICRPLREIVSKTRLECLDITVFNLDDRDPDAGLEKWNELEKALLAPDWSYLKRVNLKVVVYYDMHGGSGYPEVALQSLKALSQNQLQRLVTSKSFDFNLIIEAQCLPQ